METKSVNSDIEYPNSLHCVPSKELISIAEEIFKVGKSISFSKESIDKLTAIRNELTERKAKRDDFFFLRKIDALKEEVEEIEDELKEVTAMRKELERNIKEKSKLSD